MGKRNPRRPDPFALIPEEVLRSAAYVWLPHFARSVLTAVAAQYRRYNNGVLELTEGLAKEYGINRDELHTGLWLVCRCGLLINTVPAKRRSGKGVPAKYALPWWPVNDFPAYNFLPIEHPPRTWLKFPAGQERIRSLRQAKRFRGWQVTKTGGGIPES